MIWLSIFLMLLSIISPYLATAAESDNKGVGQASAFRDIQSHWARKDIIELSAANIVAGFKDGSFQPNGNVTREQFLKMLVELRKLPLSSSDVPFKDVEQGRWSAPYIAAGLMNGVLLPADFPDGFKPSQPITRYEMAVWIVRALQLPPPKEEKLLGKVKDQADIKNNRDLIEAALGTGIIRGNPDGSFKGGNNSTRAEAAVMLVRALHYSPGQLPTTESEATRKIVEYKPEVKQSKSTIYSKRDDVTWVINDPNLKLDVGDVFVMPPNDKYYGGIAKKVESVTKENGVLVVKTSVPKLREVFSKLDVHTTEAITSKMLVPANSSIQITTNDVAIQSTAVTLPCRNIALNNVNYEGIVLDARMNFCNLGVIADIGLDVDIGWFDFDLDFYSKLVLTGDITTNVTVKADTGKGALTKPKFIPLTAPFYVPVFTGVFIKGQLNLRIDPNFKASVVIKFEDRFHLEEGFSYSLSNGFRAIDKTTNTATLDVNSKADASIAAGPDFQLTLTLLDIAYAGIELYPGIQAGYNRHYEQGRCDSINVDAFLKLDVIAGYDVWVAKDKISKNLLNLKYPLYQLETNCPPPQSPTNLNAKLIRVIGELGKYNEVLLNRTDVQLSWATVNDATSYNVKRADAPGGPFNTIRSKIKGTTYTDVKAIKGNTYYYQVTAVNEHGESASSRTLAVTIVEPPPPSPQNLTAVREGSTVTLNWNKISSFIVYNVKRSEGSSKPYETIGSNIDVTTFTDITASFLKGYSYIVTAVDKSGESEGSNIASVKKGEFTEIITVTPQVPVDLLVIPPAPDNFIAEPHSGKVILRWNTVSNVIGYNVKRSNAFDGNYETIVSKVTDTTFIDTTAENGKTYYYKVTAVNSMGKESKDSLIKEAKPLASDLKDIIISPIKPVIPINPILVRMLAPGNFNASTDVGSGKVILSWNSVEGATGYNVMRSGSTNGTYQTIGSQVSGTKFTDTTAAIGTTYYYKVTAVNSKGDEGNATSVKSATPSNGIR
ncbi:S-layer homology domain-containing protein [Cohnella abietis]|uniref:Cellulosome-anchoring protein n=1 Tax=Cohnella abietis TaxID=2507935 RepID=A0A3T1CYG3_9BACL|nr:S-layer homology domain-containing protein [Cohnella abietis]BBI30893.1 hypothetical protein KCTCHS21_02920 [Cohnella abietis]